MRSRVLVSFAVVAVVAFASSGCKLLKKKSPQPAASVGPVFDDSDSGASAAADAVDAGSDATVAVAATHTAAIPAHEANPFAAGQTWTGTYVCGQGLTNLVLHVARAGANVDGTAEFTTKTNIKGVFKVAGPYSPPTRHLHLEGTEWVVRPGNFVTVNFDGHVSADGKTFSGNVQGPGCTTFSVKR